MCYLCVLCKSILWVTMSRATSYGLQLGTSSFVNLAYLQQLGQQPKWLLTVFSIDQLLPASTDSSRACARLCRTVVFHKYLLLYVNDRHLLTSPRSRLLCIGGERMHCLCMLQFPWDFWKFCKVCSITLTSTRHVDFSCIKDACH